MILVLSILGFAGFYYSYGGATLRTISKRVSYLVFRQPCDSGRVDLIRFPSKVSGLKPLNLYLCL